MLSIKLEVENALQDQALHGQDRYRKYFQPTFNQVDKLHKSRNLQNLYYKFYTDIEELLDDTAAADSTNIEQVILVLHPEQYFRGKIYRKSLDTFVDIKSLLFSTKTSSIYIFVDVNNQGLILTDNANTIGLTIDQSTLNLILQKDGTSTNTNSQIYIGVLNNVDFTAISIDTSTIKIIDSEGKEYLFDLTKEASLTLYKEIIIKKIPLFVVPYIETANKDTLSSMRYVLIVDFDSNKITDITTADGNVITVNFSDVAKDLSDLLKLYYVDEKYGRYYYIEVKNSLTPLLTKVFVIYNSTQHVFNPSTILSRVKLFFDLRAAKSLIGSC